MIKNVKPKILDDIDKNILIMKSIQDNILHCENWSYQLDFFTNSHLCLYGFAFDELENNLKYLRNLFDETYLDITLQECSNKKNKKKIWVIINIIIKKDANKDDMISLLRLLNKIKER